ncbi:predicted protein [Histoplasma capsulatum G186AR]|uniref:Uncharacterized protein n=1 Tax=Ajellomyces capsulatus (strain G186AR / H82 / ATCC MYA-2454 / RMSCC 2432) TaxID=447093 RepID=C0NLD0_AJECG|nr:uncharacterized protein HCBG_04310 [Histoplasma capsulatum G186AR]EEH07431.1 predicted protein [Histoplasma capsulatum G186AR]
MFDLTLGKHHSKYYKRKQAWSAKLENGTYKNKNAKPASKRQTPELKRCQQKLALHSLWLFVFGLPETQSDFDKMPQGTRTQTTYVYGGKEAFSYGILVPPLNLLSATRRHCSISLAMGRLSVVLGISEPPVTRHMVHNV